jgi:hypothetical protein
MSRILLQEGSNNFGMPRVLFVGTNQMERETCDVIRGHDGEIQILNVLKHNEFYHLSRLKLNLHSSKETVYSSLIDKTLRLSLCSQDSVTGPHPESNETGLHPHILFLIAF